MAWSAGVAGTRLALAAGLAVGICPMTLAAGGLTLLADRPLPVAVRDGGVAEATVRAIPFALGAATLDGPTATALDAYLAASATDCLLFAQAIGHVRPGAQADGDTLAAHRLARARSETVSAALLRAGLPRKAVSTVWDRQFIAREPRVTLWLFTRPVGDDCTGAPLPGAAAAVAVVSPRLTGQRTAVASTSSSLEPAPGIHLPDPVRPEPRRGWVAISPATAAPPIERVATPAGGSAHARAGTHAPPRVDPVQTEPARDVRLVAVKPAVDRPGAAAEPPKITAQAAAPPQLAAASAAPLPEAPLLAEPKAGPTRPATAAPSASSAPSQPTATEIVFAPDSSYLPDGAEARLAGLLAALRHDATWEVELQASIDDRAGKLPSERAVAYNHWLAERRQSRVEEWLGTRTGGPMLRVRRSTIPHDPSRRVVVSIRPIR